MYIFKNALISITRNKGRNILIGIIIVVISCATAVTLAIRNSANSLIESYENQYDVTATIGINRELMLGEMKAGKDATTSEREEAKGNMIDIFSSISEITVEEIKNYGDSEYVKEYYYQNSVGMNSGELEAVSQSISNTSSNDTRGPGGKQNFQNISQSDFTLIGYSSALGMEEFISGKYSVIDGAVFDDFTTDTCVINNDLAILNGIEVGDSISLVDPTDDDNVIVLEVTGIFEETTETTDAMGMFTTSANTIFTNVAVVAKLALTNAEMQVSTIPTFVLVNKDVIEDFQREVVEKGLSEYLTVSTNLEQVESATSTISNVSNFATTFLVITLLIGGIVLLLQFRLESK